MSRVTAASPWREGRLWKVYSAAALALTIAYYALGGNVDAQSAIYGLLGAAAPIAILFGVWRYRPERRLHWLLFAGGLVLWCVGDTYWNYYVWVLDKQAPYPSFADVAYLSAYPLLIGGVFVLARSGGRPRMGDMLDAAIVALAAGVVSVLFLLEPLLSTTDGTFLKVIAGGVPVLDVVLLIVLAQLLFRARVTNFAQRIFMVGTGALLVSDAVYAYLGLKGTYTNGMIVDVGWLACYGLWGMAALHPSMARIGTLPDRERVGLSGWRVGALLAALLVAPIVLFARSLHESTEGREIAVVIVATMLLVGARVWILQRDSKKAQDALAQADERLGLAKRVAGISTWDIDLLTGELVVSEELATRITGSAGTDVTVQDWISFIHPDDRDRVMAAFTRARERGGDFEQEYRFRSPTGEEGWLFARGQVFLEASGAPRAYGVVVDVTLRRWMEEQLKRSEEGMRLAQELGGIGTWDTNLETGETTWSQNLRRIAGVADTAEGNHELFMSLVHPDDRAALEASMATADDNGGQGEFEYRLVRPSDGGVRWFLSRGNTVAGPDGRTNRFLGVAVDITNRHAMEERLAHSEERLQLAQELGGVGTWDADLETGETTWSKNLRRLSGVDDDVDGSHESFMALVYPDDRAGLSAAMDSAIANGEHFEFEYRLVRPNDGELRWMLTRGDAVTGPDGKSTRFLGVAVDITDRRLAQEHQTKLEHQLRQAHKLEAVGRLAGGIAHDFNNILLAIRGNGELALDALKAGDDAVEDVEEMVAASERAAALTGQLLAFSRQQVLQAEVLDLNEVVGDMDKLLRRMIGENVELQTVVADEPVHVSADRSQVEQVIANLAVNARDAMADGGELMLEVSTILVGSEEEIDLVPGSYAAITVSDTGRGMDAETVAKIFDPFFTTKVDGTGFGLSTVHGIVVQSGGSIWVYSEVDHGTTFKVFLPLAEQAQPLESRKPDLAGVTQTSGETILLVEDDPHVQRIVRNILHKSRYRVLPASGGEEALELARVESGTIDLLLSDLVMPGTSGRVLAEKIRVLRPDIAILYMSGYTDDVVLRRGVLESGMAFIQKPFGADALALRIREVLDAHNDRPAAAA